VKRELACLTDPLILEVMAYWDRIRGPRRMPRREEIDPVLLPRRALPHIFIADVVDGTFRYRLAGTDYELNFGRSLKGCRLQDLPLGTEEASVFGQFEEAVATALPTYCEHDFIDARGLRMVYRRLLLPLSPNGNLVTGLFGICIFSAPHSTNCR
jgi:hypothetical protein